MSSNNCYPAAASVLIASGISAAAESDQLRKGVPPLTGTAVVREVEGDRSQWEIALTMPSESWKATKAEMPKLRWPKVAQTVRKGSIYEGTMKLPLGDASQPVFCRVTDISGKDLKREQILKQLKTKHPVLISVDGRMPDACHLRLPTPARLIVLLGPGEKQAANDAPSRAANPTKEPEIDLKDWTEEKSQQYFFKLMQNSQTFKIKSKEEASKYLQGIWRLDKRAHIGGGHYVRADRGEDVAVICTEEWLVVRALSGADPRDMAVARFNRIEFDERGHLHVKAKDSISFGHFQPLDKEHMAVLAYDYIAVVRRIACETSGPAVKGAERSSNSAEEKKAVEQIENDAVEAAKAHLRALLTNDRKFLSKSYVAKVRMLRRDEVRDREKVIDAALKQFAGGGDVPAKAIRQLLDRMKLESLKVAKGEFVTEPSPAIAAKDGTLRFQIEEGDAVVRIMQGPSAWFLQFRRTNGERTVVAEYTD